MYYATSMFDHFYSGVTYSRPEAWYFWGYYFATNFVWMVIPGGEFSLGYGLEVRCEIILMVW